MIEVLTSALSQLVSGFVGFFQRGAWDVLHDCLDIGLVAVLIYWALVILRGTRAMQVAIGLCLVFVGYLFARRVGLVTVTTILDSVLAYLAVIVVIIFQSDIRRALARMGRRPLLRGQRTAKETQTIEEVIKAAGTLAQKRIGALIAFERSAALDYDLWFIDTLRRCDHLRGELPAFDACELQEALQPVRQTRQALGNDRLDARGEQRCCADSAG